MTNRQRTEAEVERELNALDALEALVEYTRPDLLSFGEEADRFHESLLKHRAQVADELVDMRHPREDRREGQE